jgi:D-alanine-D-alanine ligase
MSKIQKRIEIARSTTKSLSSMSERSGAAILATLEERYESVRISTINTKKDLEALVSRQPDLVFMGLKYVPDTKSSQKIWISDFLDLYDIPYTGSRKYALEHELDKSLAKQCIHAAGIPTARSMVVKEGQLLKASQVTLRFPLFVKPANLGGGVGVDEASHVTDMSGLQAKVRSLIDQFHTDILVEEYLPGREFSVALLRDETTDELVAMPIELGTSTGPAGGSLLSQEVKQANEEIILPVTDIDLRAQIISMATGAFNALDARDYGRIDIRLDAHGVPHFLEANLIPSLISGYGSFPKACVLNQGMGYAAMIQSIVDLAFSHAHTDADQETALTVPVFKPAIA